MVEGDEFDRENPFVRRIMCPFCSSLNTRPSKDSLNAYALSCKSCGIANWCGVCSKPSSLCHDIFNGGACRYLAKFYIAKTYERDNRDVKFDEEDPR